MHVINDILGGSCRIFKPRFGLVPKLVGIGGLLEDYMESLFSTEMNAGQRRRNRVCVDVTSVCPAIFIDVI